MIKLTNHFLVSTPIIRNNVFDTSVVYVTEHDVANGAVGVMINKPISKTFRHAFRGLDLGHYSHDWNDKTLYLGGPVCADNSFILRRSEKRDNQLFELTNNRNILEEMVNTGNHDDVFVSVGYTAWADYQMEHEILRNEWLVVQADPGLIFDVDPIDRYTEALRLLGVSNLGQIYCSSAAVT